jgi:hypothetical protein
MHSYHPSSKKLPTKVESLKVGASRATKTYMIVRKSHVKRYVHAAHTSLFTNIQNENIGKLETISIVLASTLISEMLHNGGPTCLVADMGYRIATTYSLPNKLMQNSYK